MSERFYSVCVCGCLGAEVLLPCICVGLLVNYLRLNFLLIYSPFYLSGQWQLLQTHG